MIEDKRVKAVELSFKMFKDRSLSTNLNSKLFADPRSSKQYATPGVLRSMQFRTIGEPENAYNGNDSPVNVGKAHSRAQVISQTIQSPEHLNSTQSRSFFSPSGPDDPRLDRKVKHSIISSIRRDRTTFKRNQPVMASVGQNMSQFLKSDLMDSRNMDVSKSYRAGQNVTEKAAYG